MAVLVSASPGLNGIEIGCVAVEDMCPDDGHESEEEGGNCCAERDKGAESVLFAEGELLSCQYSFLPHI